MDLKEQIISKRNEYRKEHGGRDPRFAYCAIELEDGEKKDVTIALQTAESMQLSDDEDYYVFYYCDGFDKLLDLCDGSNDEFVVTGIIGYDNSIF